MSAVADVMGRPSVVVFTVSARPSCCLDVEPKGVNVVVALDVDALREALELVEFVVIESDCVDCDVVDALTVARAGRVPVALHLRCHDATVSALPPSVVPDVIVEPEVPLVEARRALRALVAAQSGAPERRCRVAVSPAHVDVRPVHLPS